MTPEIFRDTVINPALYKLGLYSKDAERLLLATAMTESNMVGTYQKGGPALGPFQMEPVTAVGVVAYADKNSSFIDALKEIEPDYENVYQMAKNPIYAAAMARLFYYRIPKELPDYNDLNAIYGYYKQFWNTKYGSATREHFFASIPGITLT